MKKPNHFSLVFNAFFSFWLVGMVGSALAATTPADTSAVPLELTPEAIAKDQQNVNVNLARWFFGATLYEQATDGKLKHLVYATRAESQFSNLLEDDVTLTCKLAVGETRLVIDIGGTKSVNRFGLFSFTAIGSVDLYYSNSSQQLTTLDPANKAWTSLNVHADYSNRRALGLDLKTLDCRYLLVVFHTTQAGDISPLALYGAAHLPGGVDAAPDQDLKDANGKKIPVKQNDLVEFDFANRAFGSKVTHVSGGNVNEAQSVLTSDPDKKLTLGDEKTSTVTSTKLTNVFVVDMGKQRDINKVGLLFNTSGPGKFEFYFLNNLPTKDATAASTKTSLLRARSAPPVLLAATAGSLAEALILAQAGSDTGVQQIQYLPDNFFDSNKPVITQDVTPDSTRVAQTFDAGQNFRFALVRWIPNSPTQPPVEILRVNLIGKVPTENFFTSSKTASSAAGLPLSVAGPTTPTTVLTQPTTGNPPGTSTNPNSNGGGGSGGGGSGGGGGGDPPPTPPPPVSS